MTGWAIHTADEQAILRLPNSVWACALRQDGNRTRSAAPTASGCPKLRRQERGAGLGPCAGLLRERVPGDQLATATAIQCQGLPARRPLNSPRVLHPLRHFPRPWYLARQEQVHRKPWAFWQDELHLSRGLYSRPMRTLGYLPSSSRLMRGK